jgi:hypothetical protein
VLIALLLSCTASPVDSAREEPVVEDSEGSRGLDPTQPSWGPAQVEAAIGEGLAQGLGEPISLRNWFVGVLALYQVAYDPEEPTCGPALIQIHDEDTLVSNFAGVCEAADGTLVDGGWIHSESWKTTEAGESLQMKILTSLTVVDNQGGVSVCGGTSFAQVVVDGQDLSFELSLGGDYDMSVDQGFLAHPVGAGLFVTGSRELGVLSANLEGGIRHDGLTLYFEELVRDPAVCEGFTGRVKVRDPSSAWLDWDLDCSSCGALSFEGQDLGEVCAGEDLEEALRASIDVVVRVQRW